MAVVHRLSSTMSDKFNDLFTKHGAASFDKQIYLDVMLGKCGWAFDLDSGVLAFRRPHEEDLQLNVQVLGTESEDSNTWLWGWANASGVPDTLLKAAHELKAFGATANIPELTTPELPFSPKVNSQRIAMIASGVLRAGCTFRAKYPHGALHLLIKDPRYKRSVTRPIPRILRVFPMFLSDHYVTNQRAAFISYLNFYRLNVREEDCCVFAAAGTAPSALLGASTPQQLTAEFDQGNRLINLQ
jgi:hypothetical protein